MSSLFVAEAGLAAAVRAGDNILNRQQLDAPAAWGVIRGYWQPWYERDGDQTNRPVGLRLTTEFAADNLSSAEDNALSLADRIGQLTAFYAGSPPHASRLMRLAEVTQMAT